MFYIIYTKNNILSLLKHILLNKYSRHTLLCNKVRLDTGVHQNVLMHKHIRIFLPMNVPECYLSWTYKNFLIHKLTHLSTEQCIPPNFSSISQVSFLFCTSTFFENIGIRHASCPPWWPFFFIITFDWNINLKIWWFHRKDVTYIRKYPISNWKIIS